MGRRRTNTKRKRLYEAKMRGKQNKLMEEAKLADPYTLKGLTMLSVAELDAHNKEMEEKRKEKKAKEEENVEDTTPKQSTWFGWLLGY
jgi:hypothetical protein